MRKIFTIIFILLVIALGGYLFISNWYNNAIYSPASREEKDIELTVSEGDSLLTLIPQLKTLGLVTSEEALKIYLRLNEVSPNIKVGTYTIASTVNIPQLIEVLEKGVFKSSVLVTIREGLRYEEIGSLLNSKFSEVGEESKFDLDEFLEICEEPDKYNFTDDNERFLIEFKPAGKPLRGMLFPDTYRFDIDVTALQIVDTLLSTFQKRLEENNIEAPSSSAVKTTYDALILASIIEKEASGQDDPALISGIFYNRLDDNYPLQADSTVNFVTGKNDAGVLISDSKIDSPYNTYKYAGLPPTPINNPGIKSIKAATKPAKTDYFFFVHDASGKSYFARTYEEHQVNVQRYL